MHEVLVEVLPSVRQNGKSCGKLTSLGEKSDGEEKKKEQNPTNIWSLELKCIPIC